MSLAMLYLVMGAAGQYEDRIQWLVAAFFTMEEAIEWRDKAREAARAALEAYKATPEGAASGNYVYLDDATPYDFSMSVHDGRISYSIQPVPLVQGPVGPSGLLPLADAYASASAMAHRVNMPAWVTQNRPVPQPVVEVKSDFADKLRSVLG